MLTPLMLSAALALWPQDQPQVAPQTPPSTQPATADPTATETQVEDIIVQGLRLQEAATDYVETIGEAPRGATLARWTRPVCVGVTGLAASHGAFLTERINGLATDLGVAVDKAGCKPNVIVLFTRDGKATADGLIQRAGLGFRPTDSTSNLGTAALRRFRTSEDAVRWWHVALPFTVDTGELAATFRGEEPRSVAVRDASRLRSNVRFDLTWVVVVVDVDKVRTTPMPALADQIAFVSLAQVNPDGQETAGRNTILNLFQPDSGVAELTAWDVAYLEALYASRADRPNVGMQEREIARGLAATRQAQAAPSPQ